MRNNKNSLYHRLGVKIIEVELTKDTKVSEFYRMMDVQETPAVSLRWNLSNQLKIKN